MADALPIVAVFVLVFAGYVLAGAIDARLQLRHPEEFTRLGNLIDSRGLNRDSLPHMGRWIAFLAWGNFSLRDVLLSALCLVYLALGFGIVGIGLAIS